MKRNEDSLRDSWDNVKCINTCMTRVLGEEREKRAENIFRDIIAENFPNVWKRKQTFMSRKHRESQTYT